MVKTLNSAVAFLWALTACTAPGDALPPDTGLQPQAGLDGGLATLGDWVIPNSVRGAQPETSKGLPAFTGVKNHLGESVSAEDLVGHFSVLWFYPMANTSN